MGRTTCRPPRTEPTPCETVVSAHPRSYDSHVEAQRTADAVAALQRYLTAEQTGDLESLDRMLSFDHAGFGTGEDEMALDRDAALGLVERQSTQDVSVRQRLIDIQHVFHAGPDVVIVMATLVYDIALGPDTLSMSLRGSYVLERTSGDWRVAHEHLSLPSSEQKVGEPYPMQRMIARTQVLEELVRERTRELHDAMSELHVAATTDRLTGLPNRGSLDAMLNADITRMRGGGRPSLLGIVDLDNFKLVNDEYGHLVGDRVLREVAEVMRSSLRGHDIVGRWGGEEFLILLNDTDAAGADVVMQRMRSTLAERDLGIGHGVTLSGGLAWYRNGETLDEWLSRADAMLYLAKHGGRDRIVHDR